MGALGHRPWTRATREGICSAGTMRRRTRAALGLWAAIVTGGVCPVALVTLAERPAHAQSATDKAAAEALFDEGKRLFLEKKFAEACPRFEASERIDPGIGTLLYLADCYENVGRIASAWATFREAASGASVAGQADRETVARERAALLEPRLYRLRVSVAGAGTPGLEVRRNGAEVKTDAWNTPLPVDPGAYTLTATAPGKKAWSARIEIPAGPGAQTVAVPALEADPVARARIEEEARKAAAASRPAAPVAPPEVPGRTQRILGGLVGSVGAAGLVTGAALAVLAASSNGDAKKACPLVPCSDKAGIDLAHQAGKLADGSTAAFVLGGAALAGGVITAILAPTAKGDKKATPSAWIAPAFGRGAAGLVFGRTFR